MASRRQRIYLIRHGETEFNRLGIFRGRYEVDLNDNGRCQAGQVGSALKGESMSFIFLSWNNNAHLSRKVIETF